MSLPEVRTKLRQLAGPIGPWGDCNQREELRRQLLGGDGRDAAETLLAALTVWDDKLNSDAVEGEVSDLLADLAEDHRIPPMLVNATRHPSTRKAALDALALNPKIAVFNQIAALAEDCFAGGGWTELAQVKYLSALASYGPAASPVLDRISGWETLTPRVRAELESATTSASMRDT